MEASPLSELSPELRNLIYESALVSDQPFIITNGCRYEILPHDWLPNPDNPLALAATCRTMRQECTQLFYNSNTFSIRNYGHRGYLTPQLTTFLLGIGIVNASALRSVTVDARDFILNLQYWRTTDHSARYNSIFQDLRKNARSHPKCSFTMRATVLGSPPDTYKLEFRFENSVVSWVDVEGNLAENTAVDDRKRSLLGVIKQRLGEVQGHPLAMSQ